MSKQIVYKDNLYNEISMLSYYYILTTVNISNNHLTRDCNIFLHCIRMQKFRLCSFSACMASQYIQSLLKYECFETTKNNIDCFIDNYVFQLSVSYYFFLFVQMGQSISNIIYTFI